MIHFILFIISINVIISAPIEKNTGIILHDQSIVFTDLETFETLEVVHKNFTLKVLEKSDSVYCFDPKEYLFNKINSEDTNSDLCKDSDRTFPFFKVQLGTKTGWVYGKHLGINIDYFSNLKEVQDRNKKFHNKVIDKKNQTLLWISTCDPSSFPETVAEVYCPVLTDGKISNLLGIFLTENDYLIRAFQKKMPKLRRKLLSIEYHNACETEPCSYDSIELIDYTAKIKKVFSMILFGENRIGGRLQFSRINWKGEKIIIDRVKLFSSTQNSEFDKIGYYKKEFSWEIKKNKFTLSSKKRFPIQVTLKKKAKIYASSDSEDIIPTLNTKKFTAVTMNYDKESWNLKGIKVSSNGVTGFARSKDFLFTDKFLINLRSVKKMELVGK